MYKTMNYTDFKKEVIRLGGGVKSLDSMLKSRDFLLKRDNKFISNADLKQGFYRDSGDAYKTSITRRSFRKPVYAA